MRQSWALVGRFLLALIFLLSGYHKLMNPSGTVQMMAAHGFVGFGLFCCLIIVIYRSCAKIQKRVRGRNELAWTADLARATQIGLVAFAAGGMFVSIATAPFLYTLAAIAVGTRSFIERELGPAVQKRARAAAHMVAQPAE